MQMFIVWYPGEFSRLYNLHPWYWNSLLYGLISSGENLVHFLQLMPLPIFQYFVPPGTRHCWVGTGSMGWEVCPTLLHMTSSGCWTPDLLILVPTLYPLGNMFPFPIPCYSLPIWFKDITDKWMATFTDWGYRDWRGVLVFHSGIFVC